MLSPLRRGAELLREVTNRERVLVLVTDGQIGNEDQLLYELSSKLTGVRVHTVGIDRAVNEGFLQRLAGSQGRCELVESEDRLDEAMHNIHRRIGTPLVTDLQVTADGLAVDTATLAPAPLPDVFPGAPVVVMGRYTGSPEGAVTVSGQPSLRTTLPATRSDNPALAALWARANVRDLEDKYVTGQTSLEEQIIETSLKFGVLSRFTAFVAVDQRVVNEGGDTRRITQPVDLPSGWEVPGPAPAAGAAMPASMPTFGAAARFSAAESTRAAPAPSYGPQGGYGSAPDSFGGYAGAPPSGPMPGGAPAPAPGVPGRPLVPPAAKRARSGRPTPPPPTPGDGASLATFVQDELTRLRGNEGQDVWLRAGLLTALSERIRVQLDTWKQNGEPQDARTTLGTLSTELASPTADAAEVDRRWRKALTTLESLTTGDAPRPRRPFWKR
jgi:Ca-activated chloride channel family protein